MEWMILPLRRYAQFSGRATRREFWMWVLFYILCVIVLSILDGLLGLGGHTSYGESHYGGPGMTGYGYGAGVRGGILTWIFVIAVLIPNIAVAVRRLHDTDRSGWWLLVWLVPYVIGLGVIGAGAAGAGSGLLMIGGLLAFVGFVGAIVLLVWYCMRGTRGPNRFGPDPLAPIDDLHETFR
jgi:uncharacterized membrane protein YhaH (DUF805 family)